jgi:hypothetical protein
MFFGYLIAIIAYRRLLKNNYSQAWRTHQYRIRISLVVIYAIWIPIALIIGMDMIPLLGNIGMIALHVYYASF